MTRIAIILTRTLSWFFSWIMAPNTIRMIVRGAVLLIDRLIPKKHIRGPTVSNRTARDQNALSTGEKWLRL